MTKRSFNFLEKETKKSLPLSGPKCFPWKCPLHKLEYFAQIAVCNCMHKPISFSLFPEINPPHIMSLGGKLGCLTESKSSLGRGTDNSFPSIVFGRSDMINDSAVLDWMCDKNITNCMPSRPLPETMPNLNILWEIFLLSVSPLSMWTDILTMGKLSGVSFTMGKFDYYLTSMT